MAGKKGDNARSNRIRFIMLDADLSEGNLSELTAAITNALRPGLPGPRPIQQITAPPPVHNNGNEDVAAAERTEESESEAKPAEIHPHKSSDGGAKYKPPVPVFLHDFDMTGFKEFAVQRNPKLVTKKYLTVAIWCKEQGKAEAITTAHVYTAFKTAGWSTKIRDWDATFPPARQTGLDAAGKDRRVCGYARW